MSFIGWERSYKSLVKSHDPIFELDIWSQLYTFHLNICKWCIYVDWKWSLKSTKKKKKDFFSNLKTCSQVPLPEQKARLHYLLLFTRLCWANVSKWIKLFAITWVITALCYTEVSQLFSNCKLVHPALGCCKCSLLTVTDVKVRSGEMTTVRLSVCPGFPWYCFVL